MLVWTLITVKNVLFSMNDSQVLPGLRCTKFVSLSMEKYPTYSFCMYSKKMVRSKCTNMRFFGVFFLSIKLNSRRMQMIEIFMYIKCMWLASKYTSRGYFLEMYWYHTYSTHPVLWHFNPCIQFDILITNTNYLVAINGATYWKKKWTDVHWFLFFFCFVFVGWCTPPLNS